MEHGHAVVGLVGLGFGGIFCLALAEKLMPLFPSYALLIFLGSLAKNSEALLLAILATTFGSAAGALAWYGSGRLLGPRRTARMIAYGTRYVPSSRRVYRQLCRTFRSRPLRLALLGQVTPVVRIYLPLAAGVLKLGVARFVIGTGIGCLLWNTLFLFTGYIIRGHSRDPFAAGLLMAIGLVCTELLIVLTRNRMVCRQSGGNGMRFGRSMLHLARRAAVFRASIRARAAARRARSIDAPFPWRK